MGFACNLPRELVGQNVVVYPMSGCGKREESEGDEMMPGWKCSSGFLEFVGFKATWRKVIRELDLIVADRRIPACALPDACRVILVFFAADRPHQQMWGYLAKV